MKGTTMLTTRIILTAAALALCGCSYVPFSGGALEGTVQPTPESWSEVAQPDIIELETNPAEPYSVKLWIVGHDADLWVHAGANRATWVEHMEADPRVRLKIGQSIYLLTAERVNGTEEFAAFADLYEQKYGNRPRNENVNEAYLFRLLPRG